MARKVTSVRGEEGGPKAEACFDVAADVSASRPDRSVGCETARSTERQACGQVWIDEGRRSCGREDRRVWACSRRAVRRIASCERAEEDVIVFKIRMDACGWVDWVFLRKEEWGFAAEAWSVVVVELDDRWT
jgi:hypothetical protein